MANVSTRQCADTISVPRKKFLNKVILNDNLSKKDLRVLLFLMTDLGAKDYKAIDIKTISKALEIGKKEVKASIENLLIEGLLDFGASGVVEDGYKLSF